MGQMEGFDLLVLLMSFGGENFAKGLFDDIGKMLGSVHVGYDFFQLFKKI